MPMKFAVPHVLSASHLVVNFWGSISLQVFVIIQVVALAHYMKRMLTPKAFRMAVTIVISVGTYA